MSEKKNYETAELMLCPLCGSSKTGLFRHTKDFAVTGNTYTIYTCSDCSFVFTDINKHKDQLMSQYFSEQNQLIQNNINSFLYKAYHFVMRITLKQKVGLVKKYTGKIVGHHLDVGAGKGVFVNAMELSGWNSIGLEPDTALRKKANELYLASLYPMQELDNFLDASYTAITMWHSLEHSYALHETIQKIKKILDIDGKLFIAVPNFQSFDARFYKHYWAAYDAPRHLYHFSPVTMKKLLEEHNLQLVEIKPMWYDSFYISILSEKYKGGNLVRALFVGALSNLRALFNRKYCSSLIYIAERKR